MKSEKIFKIIQIVLISIGLVLLVNTVSFSAVVFDVDAIDAEITAAIVTGEDPVLVAKGAVANAVRAIVAANPNYPGGQQALNAAILDALTYLKITGLDDTDLFISANHALGNTVDSALEAFEKPETRSGPSGGTIGGDDFGPSGPSVPGSPT
jgi:hypothetical protein